MAILESIVLAVLMLGNTHYIDVGAPTDAVIYYQSDKVAFMTLPGKPTLQGALTMGANGYHIAWQNGPAGNWQIQHQAGKFTYIGPDGKAAGTITRIVPGNPERY
jgi:hypothetical protein